MQRIKLRHNIVYNTYHGSVRLFQKCTAYVDFALYSPTRWSPRGLLEQRFETSAARTANGHETAKPKTRKSTRLGSGGRVFDSKIRWPTRTTRTRRAAAEKKLTAADGSENAPARRPGPAGRAPHEARGAGRLPPRCYVTKYTFIMLSVGPDARARREGSRRRKSRRRPDRGVPRGDFKSGTW